uniref:TTF-type domain-containing protein n=1 Tax=Ciona intestinalis TaxID=7719 RepID=H2XJG8_CIOIN
IKKTIIAAGPKQPKGPFPKDPLKNGRSFSTNYYYYVTQSGLKLRRYWLCYSPNMDRVYCQPCYSFSLQNLWGTAGLNDWRHLSQQIRSHESSALHAETCVVYDQWRNSKTIEEALHGSLQEKTNFWHKVLERLLNITLMLAMCNLPFRGSSEDFSKDRKDNFLSIIQLLAKYDTVLDILLQLPKGSPKYLSPSIQNELISLLAEEVLRDIKSELQSAPFFAIILDTTQDVSKKDQLSEVFRYVKIVYHDDGTPSELKVVEAFNSFTEVEDSSAIGLHKLITDSIQQKRLDIKKCRGQGYDGAAVMSGKYSGLQKRIQDVAPHAYYVHCASHNLNLVLKDAMEAVTETRKFYDTIESVYSFFGHSIVRWQKLQNVQECSSPNPTLKTLNPTRWSGRYDAVYALKERFFDVMKCLTHIILTSTKPKERDEAMTIKKQMENFDFVFMLVVQCKVLQIVNIPSKAMQCKTIDLISAHKLLQTAAHDIAQLRRSFDAVIKEASSIASQWGLPRQFLNKRAKKTKTYFDEVSEGITLSDPKKRFRVTVFHPMMDKLSCQLINRFEGMKSVVTTYQVLEPSFLSSASHLDIEVEAKKFADKFADDVSPLFPSQILSIKTSFKEKIEHLKSAKEMASFLIVENASLATSYPDVCTAYMMYLTVPVTVATAERSFSKLKLIKNFLRSSMSQERLSGLSLLSIENERAKNLDFRKVIQQFASVKARRKNF